MTKKELVAELRKKFNTWVKDLPDVEYKRSSYHSDFYSETETADEIHNDFHTLELGAEEED